MDKNEIVIGGVYECAIQHNDLKHIKHVTIMSVEDYSDYCLCVGDKQEIYATLREMGKQIGYDATYSDEYKQLESKISLRDEFKSSLSKLSFSDVKLDTDQQLGIESLVLTLQDEIAILRGKLDAIKATSWGIDS